MSDEAHFHLDGYVNKQNYRFWNTENPRNIHEKPLHAQKVTVWCGIMNSRIIGPYFFEDDNGVTTTVSGENYRKMLQEYLLPHLEHLGLSNLWFQQDGATPHTARLTMEILREAFSDRIISRFSDFSWPPRSPDLSPLDFFLWGYLKGRVYITKPSSLEELKSNIMGEINMITSDTLGKVMENAVKRMHACLDTNGDHLRDIIFKK